VSYPEGTIGKEAMQFSVLFKYVFEALNFFLQICSRDSATWQLHSVALHNTELSAGNGNPVK
jgi:hypothetical protein